MNRDMHGRITMRIILYAIVIFCIFVIFCCHNKIRFCENLIPNSLPEPSSPSHALASTSVIQFIQRQGRAGRRRDGTVAILPANCTADQVNAALLDKKLVLLPGIYYNVQRLSTSRIPHDDTPAEAMPARKPKIIAACPSCLFSTEIVTALKDASYDVLVDQTSPADVLLPNGVGIRVITTADAECWDDETTKEELPGITRPVLAIWVEASDDMNENQRESLASDLQIIRITTPHILLSLIQKMML